MSYKVREEVVGKRFLSVRSASKLKSSKIQDWEWRGGVVRAATTKDKNNPELSILVEFDDRAWHRREWVKLHDNIFQVFLVESTLVWGTKADPAKPRTKLSLPCLTFTPYVVDDSPVKSSRLQPVEFLHDSSLEFLSAETEFKTFKEEDLSHPVLTSDPDVRKSVKNWTEEQNCQKILLTTPSVLVGYRLKVYRAEGTTQWYTAVIKSYNDTTRELTVVDDTVLEEHCEDPLTVQMRLIGDGIVDSILKGVEVGITPRRRSYYSRDAASAKSSRTGTPVQSTTKPAIPSKPSIRKLVKQKPKPEVKKKPEPDIVKPKVEEKPKVEVPKTEEVVEEPNDKTRSCRKRKLRPPSKRPTPGPPELPPDPGIPGTEPRDQIQEDHVTEHVVSEEHVTEHVVEEKKKKKKKKRRKDLDQCVRDVVSSLHQDSVSTSNSSPEKDRTCSTVLAVIEDVVSGNTEISTPPLTPRPHHGPPKQQATLSSIEETIESVAASSNLTNLSLLSEVSVTHQVLNERKRLERLQEKRREREKRKRERRFREKCASQENGLDLPLERGDLSESPRLQSTSSVEEESMHFKKHLLLSTDTSEKTAQDTLSASINVQHSVTDQLAKLAKSEKFDSDRKSPSRSRDGGASSSTSPLLNVPKSESVQVYRDPELLRKEDVRHISSVQHSAIQPPTTTPVSSVPTFNNPTTTMSAHQTLNAHTNSRGTLLTPLHYGLTTAHLQQAQMEHAAALAARGLHPQHLPFSALQQQQQLYYGLPGNVSLGQLEHLWRQKNPSLPVPPPWMLIQSSDELLRDVNILREREMVERERIERQRLEQERSDRERKEKERSEREQREREDRINRERAEMDRQEQERKDRQDRERHEREQRERAERHRVLTESAAAIAVNQHFTESLRIAKQKASGMWTPSSMPSRQMPPSGDPSRMGDPRMVDPSRMDPGRMGDPSRMDPGRMGDPRMGDPSRMDPREPPRPGSSHHPAYHGRPGMPDKKDDKDPKDSDRPSSRPPDKYGPEYTAFLESQQELLLKQSEEKRRLALQQEQMIKTIQLQHETQQKILQQHQHLFDKEKSTASLPLYYRGTPVVSMAQAHLKQEPNFNIYNYPAYPQMYISSDKIPHHGRGEREEKKMTSQAAPVTSQKDEVKEVRRTSVEKEKKSPKMPHFTPAPMLEKRPGSSHYVSPRPAHDQPLDFTRHKASRPSSPLHVASPQQLSAAMLQPMELKSQPKPPFSNYQKPEPRDYKPEPRGDYKSDVTRTDVRTAMTYVPPRATSPLRKPKPEDPAAKKTPPQTPPLSTTVTHTVAMTTTSPVTTMTSSTSLPSTTSSSPVSAATRPSSTPGTMTAASSASAATSGDLQSINSFKTFVENTVQSVFEEKKLSMSRHPKTKHKQLAQQAQAASQAASTVPGAAVNQAQSQQPTTAPQPQTVQGAPAPHPPLVKPGSPSNADGSNHFNSSSSSSSCSLTETINRVANGLVDTDSDTLSAPSPPPRPGDRQPAHPKNLKKAWLQRHSDEDKLTEQIVKTEPPDDSKPSTVKDCYVNCSYISPTKEGEAKSPISALIQSSKEEDVSTTSASETESGDQKRLQRKRHRRNKQRVKGEKEPKRKRLDEGEKVEKVEKVEKMETEVKMEDENSNASKASETSTSSGGGKKKGKKVKEVKEEVKVEVKAEPQTSAANQGQSVSSVAANKPLLKHTLAQLKKNLSPFLQNGPCTEVTPKLMKCRECKMTPQQNNEKMPNIFCRFYAFRRIRYNKNGHLGTAGFSEPGEADPEDVALWQPDYEHLNPPMSVEVARYVISHVGDKFCQLVEQESEAKPPQTNNQIAWKRAVQGVREMCDVCDTTLFNMHWCCHKCGFVVCLDCYKNAHDPDSDVTKNGDVADDVSETGSRAEEHQWLTCSAKGQPHEPSKMMLTQIIPANVLWELGRLLHEIRDRWSVQARCSCHRHNKHVKNGHRLVNGDARHVKRKNKHKTSPCSDISNYPPKNSTLAYNTETASPLSILADVASMDSEKAGDKRVIQKAIDKLTGGEETSITSEEAKEEEKKACSTLRELLTKNASGKLKDKKKNSNNQKPITSTLDDIIQSVVEKSLPKDNVHHPDGPSVVRLCHYVPKNGFVMFGREEPVKVHTLTETSVLYPDVPHSWLCDGRLLRLHDPKHRGNLDIFQTQWKIGQPVLVSGCHKSADGKLWNPEAFAKEFGHIENDLVNCHNGTVLVGKKMRDFWLGFERMERRLVDDDGEPMLLKLKDWPPTEDFSDLLPSRFKDLMKALPLPEYSHRTGILNLASRLPDFFVKPDLGPKMYNAYGSSYFPKEGTTNLHLDVSDAVNLMVYVGVPNDHDRSIDHEAAALKAIDEAGCDTLTRRRVREVHERPGALWHIFDAQDADKIRDLLNKVAKEQGEEIESDHDAIHDQSWYLDVDLRRRLREEYGVEGYTIVQCLGDAVFIPAGAPHQVRNLHSCIKVAEDFVSPEHLHHCFRLTHEFRHLSDTHTNHEDKLQVKNIIYHAVKDAVAVLAEHHSQQREAMDTSEADQDTNV